MYSVLLTIHILVTLFLIGIILIQRSASDGMGLSSSSSTSFLSGRAAASAVTRATAILAFIFICTSLGLGILTARNHAGEGSILDKLNRPAPATSSSPLLPATPPAANPVSPKIPVPDPSGTVNPSTSVVPPSSVPAPQPAAPTVPRPE